MSRNTERCSKSQRGACCCCCISKKLDLLETDNGEQQLMPCFPTPHDVGACLNRRWEDVWFMVAGLPSNVHRICIGSHRAPAQNHHVQSELTVLGCVSFKTRVKRQEFHWVNVCLPDLGVTPLHTKWNDSVKRGLLLLTISCYCDLSKLGLIFTKHNNCRY